MRHLTWQRVAWRLGQAAVVTAMLVFVGREIVARWSDFASLGSSLSPDWALMAASAAAVLCSYVVLIWTWQHTVRAWGERLPFGDAARIWFVSNLGRYVPGKVWQIGAMGILAQRVGVSPVAAVGSSLVVSIVNVLAGAAVAAVASSGTHAAPPWAFPATIALSCAVIAAPWLLPVVGRVTSAVLRREIRVPALPHSAIWIAAVGCTAAWLLYGVAFRWMHIALLGHATGTLAGSTSAFTWSYLIGFLVLFAPGGIGVREYALIPLLASFGIASGGEALLVALGSRLWLTILEVVPGLVYLIVRRPAAAPPSPPPA